MCDDPHLAEPTRWLDATELDAWIPFSGMLLTLLSSLDAQLQRDSKVSLFGYLVLAGLSESPDRTLPMSELAVLANGSLSRLSHAVSALERRGWVRRSPAPHNGRITNAVLTDEGYTHVLAAAPAHVGTVRRHVLDVLDPRELATLGEISRRIMLAMTDGPIPGLRRRAEAPTTPDR
ncbi:MAG TPA: MarR family transcriptional regulator [Pseudonocardia sp.]|jgi:DNA-binding MarR family transcriptional regulator|nr:MarR family transcriptional regulator [Pseudonocardia sp.]